MRQCRLRESLGPGHCCSCCHPHGTGTCSLTPLPTPLPHPCIAPLAHPEPPLWIQWGVIGTAREGLLSGEWRKQQGLSRALVVLEVLGEWPR